MGVSQLLFSTILHNEHDVLSQTHSFAATGKDCAKACLAGKLLLDAHNC